MKKAYQHDNFIDHLLRLLLQYSKMLFGIQFFKCAVMYLLDFALSFKYFWSSVLQIIYSAVSRVSMMVTVAPCFVAIFNMLLEYIVTGLIMCYFYACLIDHFLVSISVVLRITLHYSTIQCNAMQCNAMQCNAMQCNAMQCNAMQCNAMQCNAMQCNAMQCNAMQCNAIQYITLQYNTIQYNTIQYNTIQYNTIQ